MIELKQKNKESKFMHFLGQYKIKINEGGIFKLPDEFGEQIAKGLKYKVFVSDCDKDDSSKVILRYCFENTRFFGDEEIIFENVVSDNLEFCVPPQYKGVFREDSYVIGVTDSFELLKCTVVEFYSGESNIVKEMEKFFEE
ncbi:MAG: hypothetical protein IJN49_08530 [Clostridia bacterium]|nr:hypothetical protein [Clostridia bacterium]